MFGGIVYLALTVPRHAICQQSSPNSLFLAEEIFLGDHYLGKRYMGCPIVSTSVVSLKTGWNDVPDDDMILML